MKHFTINMTLAVAALTLAAGTVSAQTVKAEIPFAFRVGGQIMQPGEYLVKLLPASSSARIVNLTNVNSKQHVLVSPSTRTDVPKAWSEAALPRLSFSCPGTVCTLTTMWMGEGSALGFHSSRTSNGEPRVAEIVLHPVRSGD